MALVAPVALVRANPNPPLTQDEDDEDTDVTNYDVGEEALDRLAIALGGKAMMPVRTSSSSSSSSISSVVGDPGRRTRLTSFVVIG